jgi:hypothetical protein
MVRKGLARNNEDLLICLKNHVNVSICIITPHRPFRQLMVDEGGEGDSCFSEPL